MNIRIDDRFIHGQIIHKWVSYLEVIEIIVADDEITANEFFCNTLRIAKPEHTRLKIIPISELSKQPISGIGQLMLVKNLKNALAVVDMMPVENIFIGRLPAGPNKRKAFENYYLDECDKKILEVLMTEKNVPTFFQVVPDSEPISLQTALTRLGND